MAINTHSTYTVYKRIANLILILIGIAITLNLWWVDQQQSQQYYKVQAQQLGRSLSQQKALDIQAYVEQQNRTALNAALEQLISDPHVVAASVYDFRGRVLATAGIEQDFISTAKQASEERLTFVADIRRPTPNESDAVSNDNALADNTLVQTIGYLQLQLASETVMAHHQAYQQQLTQQRLVFMLLAALGALYVTRAFYKLRFQIQRRLRAKRWLNR